MNRTDPLGEMPSRLKVVFTFNRRVQPLLPLEMESNLFNLISKTSLSSRIMSESAPPKPSEATPVVYESVRNIFYFSWSVYLTRVFPEVKSVAFPPAALAT